MAGREMRSSSSSEGEKVKCHALGEVLVPENVQMLKQ